MTIRSQSQPKAPRLLRSSRGAAREGRLALQAACPVIFVLVVLLVAFGGLAFAAEPAETTDEALLRQLLGEDQPQAPTADAADRSEIAEPQQQAPPPAHEPVPAVDPQAIERILSGLRRAEAGLAAGRTDDSTRGAQLTAIAELERLIDAAKKQPSQSQSDSQSGRPSPQPQPAGTASPNAATGETGLSGSAGATAGQPAPGREGKADASSDLAREGRDPNDVVRDYRFEIVRDAWGHLPPRLRDQLLNAGSDRYLPQYDSLVRRYFESLAQPETEPRP